MTICWSVSFVPQLIGKVTKKAIYFLLGSWMAFSVGRQLILHMRRCCWLCTNKLIADSGHNVQNYVNENTPEKGKTRHNKMAPCHDALCTRKRTRTFGEVERDAVAPWSELTSEILERRVSPISIWSMEANHALRCCIWKWCLNIQKIGQNHGGQMQVFTALKEGKGIGSLISSNGRCWRSNRVFPNQD